jgi:nucleoside-diphosphate-sugar epimerase
MSSQKEANWLILGGCGFIGRNLVHHLLVNRLAKKIRICDKTQPALANMNATHKLSFEEKQIVEFKSADLSKDGSRIFLSLII